MRYFEFLKNSRQAINKTYMRETNRETKRNQPKDRTKKGKISLSFNKISNCIL